MSPRLIWARLIPASDSRGVSKTQATSCTSEELINIEYNIQRLSLSYNMAMFTLAPSHVLEILPCLISVSPKVSFNTL